MKSQRLGRPLLAGLRRAAFALAGRIDIEFHYPPLGNGLQVPAGDRFAWEPDSTYIRRAPYFDGMPPQPPPPLVRRDPRVGLRQRAGKRGDERVKE